MPSVRGPTTLAVIFPLLPRFAPYGVCNRWAAVPLFGSLLTMPGLGERAGGLRGDPVAQVPRRGDTAGLGEEKKDLGVVVQTIEQSFGRHP